MLVKRDRRRFDAGFTLIELLVVIGIIAALGALAAGAYFKVSASQQQKRTEATLKKIHKGLESQWAAARDDVENEIKNGKATAAGMTKQQYLNTRMMQEFPTRFSEARPPSGKYSQLNGAPDLGADKESAVCLYLALSKARRGATFSPDEVGPGSVKTEVISGVSFTFFVDSWDTPIRFNRPDASNPANGLFVESAGKDKNFAAPNDNDNLNSFLLVSEGARGN